MIHPDELRTLEEKIWRVYGQLSPDERALFDQAAAQRGVPVLTILEDALERFRTELETYPVARVRFNQTLEWERCPFGRDPCVPPDPAATDRRNDHA